MLADLLELGSRGERIERGVHGTGDEVLDRDDGEVGEPLHHRAGAGVEGVAGEELDGTFDEILDGLLAEGTALTLKRDDGTHETTSSVRPTEHKRPSVSYRGSRAAWVRSSRSLSERCSPTSGVEPVMIPFATSNSTTGRGLVVTRYSTECASTRMSARRGSPGPPLRSPPSSPNHAFQSGLYSSLIRFRSWVMVAVPATETHSRDLLL